jgi:Tat protein translocase TatC
MWQGILTKVFKAREKFAQKIDNPEDSEKPFIEHLEDLRLMMLRIALTLLGATVITFIFYKELFNAILYPLVLAGFAPDIEQARKLLINLDIAGPFMMAFNVALIAAAILSFPILLIFLLQFILPGLKPSEKKVLFPVILIGTGLFLGGVAFAYWLVLPRALTFFSEFASTVGATQNWSLQNYITFTTRFILVFGIAFELPVIVMALVKLDFINFTLMKSTWRYAIIAITFFAAIITPTPDILTLALMSLPLYVLYGVCMVLAYKIEKKDRAEHPEYYAELQKNEQELSQQTEDEWDNPSYNPWSRQDDDEDEDSPAKLPEIKPAAHTQPVDSAEPESPPTPPPAS